MIVVDVEVWYWQPSGMSRSIAYSCGASRERYITVREAERLAEEAHRRGYQEGYEEGAFAATDRRTD